MKNRTKFILPLIILFLSFGTHAQNLSPVNWEFRALKVSETEYELQALALIDKPWHLYGQYFEDGGPVRLKFNFVNNENYILIDSTIEKSKSIIEKDEIFGIDVHYFKSKAMFIQKVKISSLTEIIMMVEGQACNDKTGMCVMVSGEHVFRFE